MIYKSVKELDPVKVGRFGLGFKSVFHITGKYILLCPFRNTIRIPVYCGFRLHINYLLHMQDCIMNFL